MLHKISKGARQCSDKAQNALRNAKLHMCVCVSVREFVCASVCASVCTYVCVCVCVRLWPCVCVRETMCVNMNFGFVKIPQGPIPQLFSALHFLLLQLCASERVYITVRVRV